MTDLVPLDDLPGSGSDLVPESDLPQGISGVGRFESGGNGYTKQHPVTGAHGKYQIMPSNWSAWAQDAGLPWDAPKTPQNQEVVAQNKWNEYLSKFGDETLAAAAWFAGPSAAADLQNGNMSVLNKKDANGTTVAAYIKKTTGKDYRSTNDLVPDGDLPAQSDVVPQNDLPEELSLWQKAAEIMSGGHISFEKPKPEVQITPEGKEIHNVPQSAAHGFFDDPVTWLAFGATKPLQMAGAPLWKKGAEAAREVIGWATGGASEVPAMAKTGIEAATRAASAKPLAEQAAARQAKGVFESVSPEAETTVQAVENMVRPATEAAPKVVTEAEQFIEPPVKPLDQPIEAGQASAGIDQATTGIKNAVVDAEMLAEGKNPIVHLESKSNQIAFNEAKQAVDEGRIDARALAEEVATTPRPITTQEEFALLYDRMRIKNEIKDVRSQIKEAQLAGDAERESKLVEQRDFLEEKLYTNSVGATHGGSEVGKSLQARTRMIREDYSLEEMLNRAKVVTGGKQIPDAVRQRLETLSKEIEAANTKIASYEDALAKGQVNKGFQRIKIETAREQRQLQRTADKQVLSAQFDTLNQELSKVLGGKLSMGLDPEAVVILGKMAKNRVQSGMITVEAVIDSIYTATKQLGLDLTQRDIRDAISGYGITTKMSQEEIEVQLRELRRQMRLVSALEDAKAGEAPLRSGLQRDAVSDEVRSLQKQVNEAMRESGVATTKSQEEQWKTSLDAIKTRLENRRKDLIKIIESGEVSKDRIPVPYDEAAKTAKQEVDLIDNIVKNIVEPGRSQMYEPFPNVKVKPEKTSKAPKELSFGEQEEIQRQAVERSIGEYLRKINENDLVPKQRPLIETPELQSARELRDSLKTTVDELRGRSPEVALQAYKTRTQNRIAELEQKMATGDYTVKAKREMQLDPQATVLKFQLSQTTKKYQDFMAAYERSQWNRLQKIGSGIGEALNLSRAIKTSFDLSAPLRQGAFIAFAHPLRALRSMPAMFRAAGSDAARFAIDQELLRRANYPLYEKAGLYLSEHGQALSRMEENYMSHWVDKMPKAVGGGFVRGSERAYTTFLNQIRANSFDTMIRNLSKNGATPSIDEMKAIANFVNVATGRGATAGAKASALVGLNTIFFAPRYVLSRFQTLAGQPLYKGSMATRTAIAKEYARFLVGLGAVYTMSKAAGAEIEFDPRSSDFGKIKIGNTRIDPLAGLSQTTVLLSRIGSGETKTLRGNIVPLRGGKVPYGGSTTEGVMARFLRSKLSPAIGTGVDVATGQDVAGRTVTPSMIPQKLIAPLSFGDIYSAMKEQGVPAGSALSILAIFGMGVQTYDPNKKR